MNMRSFSEAGLYDSEDEADVHGINYGQRVIDGKVPINGELTAMDH
jgi:hypothetical protein